MLPFRRSLRCALTGGGGTAFSPTTVSGMAAWWAARLESFANNDPVGTATDWTGSGKTLTQATASKQPLFLTGQKNGLPAFSADGVDDFLSAGDVLNIGTGSIHFFIVLKFDSTANQCATSKYPGGTAPGIASFILGGGWSAPMFDGVDYNSANGGVADTNWHLFEVIIDRPNTRASIFIDGVEVGVDSGVAAGNLDNTARFLLFAHNNGTDTDQTFYMGGKIAEVWCWQRVLTAGERTTLRDGVNSLYAIY